MKTTTFTLCLLLSAAGAQAGTVQVNFIQPDRYADAGHGADAEAVRRQLDQHLQSLGQHWLPPGQTLTIAILDIDLAGETRPLLSRVDDLRVVTGRADWPRIRLHYSLVDGGQTIASGDEALSDLNYLSRQRVGDSLSSLPYDRRMLSDWFRKRFAPEAAH
jgi:hypothetical protein